MKRNGLFIFLLMAYFTINAQIHELGLFAGGSNTISDIGPTNFVYTNSPAFGLIYKWNVTTRYAIRSSYMRSTLKNNDVYSSDLSRFRRFLNVENTINEFSLGMEVNFFDFNLHDDDKEFTPYVYSGINYFSYDLLYVPLGTGNDVVQKYDAAMEISIPAVVGVKASISPLFVLSFEAGIRYALTDNLDGSNPLMGQFQNDPRGKHGSFYNKDWYVFTGFSFSYTFGQIPCYCKEKK